MGTLKRLLEDYQEAMEDREDAHNYGRKRDKRLGEFEVEEYECSTSEDTRA